MGISRRDVLKLGMLQAGALVLPAAASSQENFVFNARRTTPSILQGATDESRTQFSVVHSVAQELRFDVASAARLIFPDHVELLTLAGQSTAVSKVYVSNLALGQTYELRLSDANGTLLETRTFQTLDTRKSDLRFAICSCMDDGNHSPEIWRDIIAKHPDFILFAGDSTYCDKGGGSDQGEQRLWRRYSEARATLEIYFSEHLVPIFATWDDHDFGLNDAGKEFPHAKESQANFTKFFAQSASHCSVLENGPGVASRFVLGGQQFVLMDDRSWRIKGRSNERFAHWGKEQEEWLLRSIANHNGVTWIANGTQFFPQMFFKESFSGNHPVQFAKFLEAIKQTRRKVVFISGDVHFSEISQIEPSKLGYTTYELTSSSIHSTTIPGLPHVVPNSRRIESTPERNYILVGSTSDANGCAFRAESRSSDNQLNFSRDLRV